MLRHLRQTRRSERFFDTLSTLMPSWLPTDAEVRDRVDRLELPFDRFGFDPYGVDKRDLAFFFSLVGWLYRHYFSIRCDGIHHVPTRGRAMVVGNHQGGVAIDGLMIIGSAFFEMEPPRLAQVMAEKFIFKLPGSYFSTRIGAVAGLPEHAIRLLDDERLLLVFPEGVRGTAKLAHEANTLVRFGTGFMRLALKTRTPIVPVAFVGGGEAFPTVANLTGLGKLFGLPYLPVTRYLLPVPRPVSCQIVYGEPMHLQGSGDEADDEIEELVEGVRAAIAELIVRGRRLRGEVTSTLPGEAAR